MSLYFERVTGVAYGADAHIQTMGQPTHAVDQFSQDHPDFRGLVEVIAPELASGRLRVKVLLFEVYGPGEHTSSLEPVTIYTMGAAL